MRLNVCKVRMRLADGTVRTSYVYGPTVDEYVRENASVCQDVAPHRILGVETTHGYKEEGGRRPSRYSWEIPKGPTHYFFNEHLSREPLSSGAGPDAGERSERTAGEVYDEQMGEEVQGAQAERPADADGDVA